MPVWSQDSNCSLCGQVLDKWGDHALACGCGGDRISRHNLIRDVVHSAANDRANLATVLEKPEDRPPDPDPPHPTNISRRPADVWVPRGPSGGPEAWDFSVTSAFKLGPSLPDASSPSGTFSSVEFRKNAFLDTASLNAARQVSPSVRWFLKRLEVVGLLPFGRWLHGSRVKADGLGPIDGSDASFKIAQRISCILHRENARAILKRAPEPLGPHVRSLGLSVLAESEQS